MLANKERFIELLEAVNGSIELTESEVLTMRTNPDYCREVLTESFGEEKANVVVDYLFEAKVAKIEKEVVSIDPIKELETKIKSIPPELANAALQPVSDELQKISEKFEKEKQNLMNKFKVNKK